MDHGEEACRVANNDNKITLQYVMDGVWYGMGVTPRSLPKADQFHHWVCLIFPFVSQEFDAQKIRPINCFSFPTPNKSQL